MYDNDNPYAAALDGLELSDPVQAFFDFCRERESVRVRRERGDAAPWSDDPIFQQGRFLNVFREDDRGTKALTRFIGTADRTLPDLVQALFFGRWCNSQTTLDTLSVDLLHNPEELRQTLETLPEQPWCNVAAYPVEPVHWKGQFHSRLDTATVLFGQIKDTLAQAILEADGDVVRATATINELFKMNNDFPIFMAVMDLAWFRPDVIDPSSHVPTGIGAVAFLDRLQLYLGLDSHRETCDSMIALQSEYWPEAKRTFEPIDIEYLSCECRKYYSYVNGTKQFEGKNAFRAGESAELVFDVDDAPASDTIIQTQIHVIAGGPCSGKTTILKALEQRGYRVEVETSERLLRAGIDRNKTSQSLRMDPVQWQQVVLQQDHDLFESLPTGDLVFTDTSFIEDLVFASRAGIKMGPGIESWLWRKRYQRVFFLEPLEAYEQNRVRLESRDVSRLISTQVRKRYQDYGYELVMVPAGPVADRLAFIVSHIA